jgi:acylphosphatase
METVMSDSDKSVHILVRGRVQGVGFRAWTHHQAELHGLRGWVRNLQDGSVEAVLCGAPALVEIVVNACREGPRGAVVEDVQVEPADADALNHTPGGGFIVLETV